jgi:phosphatidate cytidylyltransferase
LIVATLEFSKLQSITSYYILPLAVFFFGAYVAFPFFDYNDDNLYFLLEGYSLFIFILLLTFLFNQSKTVFSVFKSVLVYIGYILIPFLILIKLQGEVYELILSTFLLIWFNDTFAYLSGINFGKNKLFSKVSPKKTIEGFVGGMIMTVLAAIVLHKYIFTEIHFSMLNWVVFALAISIFGTLGDLVQSKLKRVAGVKDSGDFMPGHGGILDRLDSVIFVTPIVYLLIKIIIYV